MVILISLVKIAHPAHVARGKARAVREIRLQKLCGCNCCALFRTLADGLANGIHFVHLRKILRENFGQFAVHRIVIHRFSDVHSFSLPCYSAHHFSTRLVVYKTSKLAIHHYDSFLKTKRQIYLAPNTVRFYLESACK